jgi:hypothetical protein
VVAAMHEHVGSGLVQQHVCVPLTNLTAGNAESQTWAGNAGAVEAVMAAVRRHVGSALIQQLACSVLRTIRNSTGNRERTYSIIAQRSCQKLRRKRFILKT